jgi:hypothetical protein
MSGTLHVSVAADNDVVLKATCYRLLSRFWPASSESTSVGVLGSARFVLGHIVEHGSRVRDKEAARVALREFFTRAAVLEPTPQELTAAAELEELAQRVGLDLDVGESLLAAIVAAREIPLLDTGDKRAVCGLDALIERSETCAALLARVRCLEQLLLLTLNEAAHELDAIVAGICAEPDVDKTASICFGCYSDAATGYAEVQTGLESYLGSLRSRAPRILAT